MIESLLNALRCLVQVTVLALLLYVIVDGIVFIAERIGRIFHPQFDIVIDLLGGW